MEKSRKLSKKIVLTEGEDERVVKAAADAQVRGIANIVLLGDEAEIINNNPEENLDGVTIVNPKTSPKRAEYAKLLYELRKNKGMTEEDADKLSYDNTYFGVLMLKAGDADGLVSGACHSTANTLRPGLQIVKTMPGVPLVSSYFLMIPPKTGNQYVSGGALVFADCGINQNPTSEELAYIAIASEKSARTIAGLDPKIAFLSHSTKGSAKHADVDKVRNAAASAASSSRSSTPRSTPPSPASKRLIPAWRARPTCSSSPISTRAISAISSWNASAALWR